MPKEFETFFLGLLTVFGVLSVITVILSASPPAGVKGTPEWKCAVEEQNVVAHDSFSNRTFCIDPKTKVFVRELGAK